MRAAVFISMNFNYCRVFFLLFLVLTCFETKAQTSFADTVQVLDDVIVSVKNYREIIPSQKLSGAQLQKLNSQSVADALRYFSGVQIKDYGGIGGLKTVNIRSMGAHHVGVFYDGIQLGNAQNGQVDLGKYSLDDMEEISLYNGQKSDIFQPAKDFGSSGSIYLKTKKPIFTDKKTNISVKYKTGSINLINPSLRIEQKISDKFSASVSSELIKSNGEYKFRYKRHYPNGELAYDTTATRKGGDIEAWRLEGSLHYADDKSLWDTKIYTYTSERGLPGAIVNNVFNRSQRLWDKNAFAQTSYMRTFSPKFKSQFRGKWAYDYTHYINPDKSRRVDNHYYQQEVYASLANMYSVLPVLDLSLSTDFQWNKLNADLRNFSYPQRYTTLAALAGALTINRFKAQASILGTFVHETVKMNSKSPDKTVFTPAVFMSYKPWESENLTLRAFYKRIFRMPTFNDLYYTEIGSTLLKPEFTDQYNVGATYGKVYENSIVTSFNIQADAYYIRVTDKIIASPATSQLMSWKMLNLGLVEIKGVDVSSNLSASVGKFNVSAHVTYTYQKAQDVTDPAKSYYKDQIPYTPWHSGSAILSAEYSTWHLNYSFIYVGERYDVNMNNIPANYLQPWYTHDLALHKDINYKRLKLRASVEVNNLLNQYYDVVLNYPMPGRNFKFILNIKL